MTDITKDELRQITERLDRLEWQMREVGEYLPLDAKLAAPPEAPARITYTEEIAQWYAEHPFTDGKGRSVDVLKWAAARVDDWYGTLDENLTWQDKAFTTLYLASSVAPDAEGYAAFHYYWSIASTHPDWNTPNTAAWLVRQARERAIAEQREAQGGNPA